jgi:D-glycero-D-manno-heptose 1,7-bisphosphate phosphatase
MSKSAAVLRPAVFLDRDGVINRNRSDYVKSWAEYEFLPGAQTALQKLDRLHWPVVVVSNQSAIGRGMMARATVDDINRRMMEAVRRAGGRIDEVAYCPHRPDEHCACRKPQPGLLLDAARRLHIDLRQSFLIGDAETDILAAQAAGCHPILVKTGLGEENLSRLFAKNVQDFEVVDDLAAAVTWIMTQAAARQGYDSPDEPHRGAPPASRS